jgi:transcriptional regulator with XRE-family HTH domain
VIRLLKGNRLREARKNRHLTQSELGNLVGVGKSAICCYEKETRNPTIETIIEFMEVLGVSADYLLGVDNIIKTVNNKDITYKTMTNEEVKFIEELRKDKLVYEMLFQDPKKGSDLIKKKLG